MRRIFGFLLCTMFLLLLVTGVFMWARSAIHAYDAACYWIRSDYRFILNSHRGTLFLYGESVEGRASEALWWTPGEDDRMAYWSMSATSECQEDYPAFAHSVAGVTWGSYQFLADAPTRHTGVGIPYWVLMLATCLFGWPCIALCSNRRVRKAAEEKGEAK